MNLRFKFLGHYFYIAETRLRTDRTYIRRHEHLRRRLEMTGNKCEHCGATIDINCNRISVLPPGTPDRFSTENIKVLCRACHEDALRTAFNEDALRAAFNDTNAEGRQPCE